MDARQAALFNTLDPQVLGHRLRAARVAAGLTQSQVAGSDITVGYMSRLEAGQRRPNAKVFELLAARLGTTADELLTGVAASDAHEVRLSLNFAELSLESGDAAEALRLTDELLRGTQLAGLAEEQQRATYVRARSLETVGRLDEAIVGLESLLASGDRHPWWVAASIVLSRCYRDAGESLRAASVGERALDTLATDGLEGSDESIQLAVTVAAAYFQQGDTGHAVRLCLGALERADKAGSPAARAAAYWNASVMEAERGSAEVAIPLAERALALLSEGRDARNLARLRSQLGTMQLQLDPPQAGAALETLTRASAELTATSAGAIDIGRNEMSLARALFLEGDIERARDVAARLYVDTKDVAPLLAADARALEGQAEASQGNWDAARAAYQDAIFAMTGVGADRSAAQLWLELGGLLEAAGDGDAARDAYRRAAISSGVRTRGSVSARL